MKHYTQRSRDGYQVFTLRDGKVVWSRVLESEEAALADLKKFQEIK